jgi:glycosyltransferase involved in cell wall biosynthesis
LAVAESGRCAGDGARRQIVFTESSPNVGGQELQLMQQMHALQGAGYLCTLACQPGGRVESTARGLGLHTVAVSFRNSFHLPSIFKLRALLSQTAACMVICHSGHDANTAAIASRLLFRRPFLLRSRTYLTGKHKAFSYNHLVDATMVPSRYMKQSLTADGSITAEKIHVVYPGIDFTHIDAQSQEAIPDDVAQWLAAAAGPVLLHVAMLRGEKGHHTILQALAGLLPSRPNLRYLIAGEGSERQAIERTICALGLQSHVFLAGNVAQVHALYRHATLVVMPSLNEPLGMSQIEALALGVPVLASRTGGIPETIDDGVSGCLIEPGNVSAWQTALVAALDHSVLQQKMAMVGRADVRERFSVESNLRQILQLECAFRSKEHPF